MEKSAKTILVIAPHPDDFVLGVGGYIYDSVKAGNRVIAMDFAVGGPRSNVSTELRLDEALKVRDFLGIEYLYELETDGLMDHQPNSEITTKIDKLFDQYKPDEVFCSYKSVHTDHIALFNAFEASLRLRTGFNPKNVYLYEYPFIFTSYVQPTGGKTYYPLSQETFDKKCECFELYKSQCRPKPSPLGVSGIDVLARTRGMECGELYAECFYSIRTVIK